MQRREQLGFGIFGWIWCVIFALSLIPSVGVSWCYSPGTSSAKKRLRYSRTFRRECLQKGRGNKCIFQQGRAVRSESTQFFRPYANTFEICCSYLCIPFNLEKHSSAKNQERNTLSVLSCKRFISFFISMFCTVITCLLFAFNDIWNGYQEILVWL